MSTRPYSRLTMDEFLIWADGRFELVSGHVVVMSPQTVGHVRAKSRVHAALARSVATAGQDCEVMADGVTVRSDEVTAFEPDALVQCDLPLADESMEATSPVLVVEVLSPSTKHVDTERSSKGTSASQASSTT